MSYQHQILGTVISSVLDYDQLCKEMGEPQGFKPETSSYCPCDGRSILQSALAKKSSLKNAPDLRGKFIRGLNQFYNIGEPDFDIHKGDEDGIHRAVGSYQPDVLKDHNHQSRSGSGFNAGGGGDPYARNDAGFNVLTDTTTAGGGKETRPRNVALLFYIKVN